MSDDERADASGDERGPTGDEDGEPTSTDERGPASDDEPVRFVRAAADADAAVAPRTAGEIADADPDVDPVTFGAAESDVRVSDLVNRGWFLSPPERVTLDPAGEPRVRPDAAAEYVTVHEERSTADVLAATVDTLWHVEVSAGWPVLVTGWSWVLDGGVVTGLVTAEDGVVPLEIPVTTGGTVTYGRETPIAQVVPVPEPLLSTSFESGVPGKDRTDAVERVEERTGFYDDPYADSYWTEKQPTRLLRRDEHDE